MVHRTALSVYRKQEFINVELHDIIFPRRRFSIDWFWQVGFLTEEIATISSKMEEIVEECKMRTGDFYCILYPPAINYFDEITEDISKFDPENIIVKGFEDYEWQVAEFQGFMEALYHFDSILPHNFKRKMYYILRSSDIIDNKVKFRILKLQINNPLYRLKNDNGMPESMATVRLKDAIRKRYKDKEKKFTEHYVGDYAHDVIIHSSDNYLSNKAFRELLEIQSDISPIYQVISSFDHAIAETSADKINKEFPHRFIMNEDFDIFVYEEELDEIYNATLNKCINFFAQNNVRISEETSTYGKRIRILYDDFTVTMFDFMTSFPGIKREIIRKFIVDRELDSYYHLSLENEVIYRLNKLLITPSKEYHEDFILEHKGDIEFGRVIEAFTDETASKARKILENILSK